MKTLIDQKSSWQHCGICYDGAAALYATQPLIGSESAIQENDRQLEPVVVAHSKYTVRIMFVAKVFRPQGKSWNALKDQKLVQAMDTALLSFARWTAGEERPSWLLSGEKVFRFETPVVLTVITCNNGASFRIVGQTDTPRDSLHRTLV